MIFQDIVALAKAGWTPKQIKEILEMVETSPKVQETKVEDLDKKEPEVKKTEPEEVKDETEDPIEIFKNLLKED